MWIISFWILPVISACMWVAMLIAMLTEWVSWGKPHLVSMHPGQRIAYISDVGATWLQPLFIAGSAVTVVFLDLAFLSERWLRHAGHLVPNKGVFDKLCAVLSILFSLAGAAGLILLSIFNVRQHKHKHDGFLVLFIAGYLLSAVFICIEYFRLGIFYRSLHRVLFISAWIKLAFIIIEVALLIAFGVEEHKGGSNTTFSAALEWAVAFIFTFYILSFVVDLLPAVRTRRHVPQGEKRLEVAHRSGHGAPYDAPLDVESAAANGSANGNGNVPRRGLTNYRRGHF